MRTKTISNLIHRLGLDFGLTDAQMKEVIESQFKFLRDVMAEGSKKDIDYKNFRLTNLGMFYVSEARRKWEDRYFNKKEEDEQSNDAGGSI